MATHYDPVGGVKNFSATVAVVGAWQGCNIGVLLLNKIVLSNYDYKYPIFLTACHMACSTVLSYLISLMRLVPHQRIRSRRQLYKVSLLAVVFCVSIVTGNASLRFIPVSFNQAIGSTTPAFTALMSYLIMGKRETRQVYISLIPVVAGIMIASGWEPSFNLLGFVLCITSTAVRALKTVVQALLLTDPSEKLSSLNLLYYMSPIALAVLLPLSWATEEGAARRALQLMAEDRSFAWAFVANVLLAYFINLTNFLVTKYTSALTLQVLGNAKGVVAVIISLLLFKNPINFTGMLGYGTCVCGVFMYSESKRRSAVSMTLRQAKAALEMLRDEEEATSPSFRQGGGGGGNAAHSSKLMSSEKVPLLDTATSTSSAGPGAAAKMRGGGGSHQAAAAVQ